MNAQVFRLFFSGGLHSGRRGIGIEETDHRLSADTLFAALLVQLAERDPSLADALASEFPRRSGPDGTLFMAQEAPFLLTSAFPFAGDVLLFPVPMRLTGTADKSLKRVKYVSQSIFTSLAAGAALADLAGDGSPFQHGAVWVAQQDAPGLPTGLQAEDELWHKRRRPRVAVDRETWRSAIFHHGETLFRAGCGLWFAVTWRDPDRPIGGLPVRRLVEALLADLTVLGIGGLRSHGLGAFTLDATRALDLPDAQPNAASVSLSRFHPAPGETRALDDPRAAYRLTEIGGWMRAAGTPDRERRSVAMIEEGAVLAVGTEQAGCLVDVSPEGAPHASWRYGLMFPVGLEEGR